MNRFEFEAFPELETERLILRRIVAEDAPAWLDVWSHPEVVRYLTDFENAPAHAEIPPIIEWADQIFAGKTGIRWAITLKPEPTLLGSAGFHLYRRADRCVEIGYELHHDYWRKGIMSEALAEVLRFCFGTLNVHRVEADVTVGNEASAGLLRSFGFTLEGTWRERVYQGGQFLDLWQFGLLENEYHAGS